MTEDAKDTSGRSLTLQPEYTLPHGDKLKEMARIGLAIAKVWENERDAPIPGSTKALREALEAAGVRFKGSRYWNSIEAAIAAAQASGWLETVKAEDGAEVYAYPHKQGIAWGVNEAGTGVNILCGVRRPDGSDEAVS